MNQVMETMSQGFLWFYTKSLWLNFMKRWNANLYADDRIHILKGSKSELFREYPSQNYLENIYKMLL